MREARRKRRTVLRGRLELHLAAGALDLIVHRADSRAVLYGNAFNLTARIGFDLDRHGFLQRAGVSILGNGDAPYHIGPTAKRGRRFRCHRDIDVLWRGHRGRCWCRRGWRRCRRRGSSDGRGGRWRGGRRWSGGRGRALNVLCRIRLLTDRQAGFDLVLIDDRSRAACRCRAQAKIDVRLRRRVRLDGLRRGRLQACLRRGRRRLVRQRRRTRGRRGRGSGRRGRRRIDRLGGRWRRGRGTLVQLHDLTVRRDLGRRRRAAVRVEDLAARYSQYADGIDNQRRDKAGQKEAVRRIHTC